jgi:FKBP-type peptidyl-prolyl cis-trans isomerase
VSIVYFQFPTSDTLERSTKDPGQKTFSFTIGRGEVIKGWDEGVAQMQVGEFATLTVSSDYGYGDAGFPAWGIPGKATLLFQIELLSAK